MKFKIQDLKFKISDSIKKSFLPATDRQAGIFNLQSSIRRGFTPLEIKSTEALISNSIVTADCKGNTFTDKLRPPSCFRKKAGGLSLTGFTLLELLIALAISSIIFLVIISTYSLTMNVIAKWDMKEEDYYLARNIFRRMQNEISSFYPASNFKNNDALEADKEKFSFYTTEESLYFPLSCLMKVTYKFVVDDEGKSLLMREEEPLVNFSLEENKYIKSYIWSKDLKDLSFQYSDGKNWYDSWDILGNSKTLQAVKITLISPHDETFSTIIYIPTEI